ncbi:hypothetical protein GJAV_G00022180 [Gymnothorax javanicus]|nr:hypothetical protein GJAV_G00022180 [Gymnothorax javanicus]
MCGDVLYRRLSQHEAGQQGKEIRFNEKLESSLKKQVVACGTEQALQLQRRESLSLTRKSEVSAEVAGSQDPMDMMVSSCLIIQQMKPLQRCVGVSRKTPQRIYINDKSTQVDSEDQLERYRCEAALVAERMKVEQQEERIRAAEEDNEALRAEKFSLELQVKSVLGKLDKMSEVCQQKDQALQQKAAQLDFERRDKDLKVKEVLKIHKQKLQAIEEQHQKSESSYKAEVAFHRKKAEENRVVAAESQHALQLQRKEVASLTQKLSELDTISSCLSVQQIRPLRRCGAVSKKTAETISTNDVSAQVESADQLERCQCEAALVAGRIKVEQQEERIRAVEEDNEALRAEKFSLELQVKSVLGKLDKMSEVCQQKDQALQQKAAQLDFERREKERKVKEVLKIHKEKVQAIEEQHQKSESSYKAEVASLEKTRDKLMKTCAPLRAPTGPRKQMTAAAKPSNATAKQQSLQQETLQSEQRKCQHLEETLQSLEQDRDALRTEISQLEDQAAAKQNELHTWMMTCQKKDQDLLESTIKMEAAEEVMQFLANKICVLEDVLQKSQSYCQAELEASEQDKDAERTRVIAQMLQLIENTSTLPDLPQTTVDLKSSSSNEELPYQSASEDVSHPGQTEVLPPETIASSSEAGTASSSAPGSSHSSPKTPADSARPRRTKKQQGH